MPICFLLKIPFIKYSEYVKYTYVIFLLGLGGYGCRLVWREVQKEREC